MLHLRFSTLSFANSFVPSLHLSSEAFSWFFAFCQQGWCRHASRHDILSPQLDSAWFQTSNSDRGKYVRDKTPNSPWQWKPMLPPLAGWGLARSASLARAASPPFSHRVWNDVTIWKLLAPEAAGAGTAAVPGQRVSWYGRREAAGGVRGGLLPRQILGHRHAGVSRCSLSLLQLAQSEQHMWRRLGSSDCQVSVPPTIDCVEAIF